MKNFLRNGNTIEVVLSNGFLAGNLIQLGAGVSSTPGNHLNAVASNNGDGVTPISCATRGVFVMTKNTGETYAQGDKLYWDATNLRCTNSTNSNANYFCGFAHDAQASGDTTVNLMLPL